MLRLAYEIQHEDLLAEAILIQLDMIFEMLRMTEALEMLPLMMALPGH